MVMVTVVQLARTLDCGSRGRVFESRRLPQLKPSAGRAVAMVSLTVRSKLIGARE